MSTAKESGSSTGKAKARTRRRGKLKVAPKPVVTLAIRPVGKTPPEMPRYSAAQLAQLLDATVDAVNDAEKRAGNVREEVADQLFRALFLNSTFLAIDPEAPVPPGVSRLLERAGKSLVLSAYELRRYVKVAAMTHHLRAPAWEGLPFDTKLDLVRLVRDSDDFDAFERAVLFANTANVGRQEVREFVNAQLPESTEVGRPRGLTLRGASSAAAPVIRLSDAAARTRLAARAARLDDAERDRFIDEMETAAENLGKLVREIRAEAAKKPQKKRPV